MTRTTRAPDPGTRHPIAVAAGRTGLSPDVLRAWERRYDVVHPTRASDGQRLYSDADVERLRQLRLATEAGRSIGQVAKLSPAALTKLVEEDAAARPAGSAPAQEQVDETVAAALVHTRAFDARGLDMLLRRSASVLGIEPFLERVAAGVLQRVGEEWHAGHLSPAQEHLASAVVQQIILTSMRELARADGPRIVVATPAGERHALGAAAVGACAAAEGWSVIYLGADLPAEDIARSAEEAGARLVALSIVYLENRRSVLAQLRRLRDALPTSMRIVAGGSGAAAIERDLGKLGIRVRATLADLRTELRATA